MKRRDFLIGSVIAGAGLSVFTLRPPARAQTDAEVVEYSLRAAPLRFSPTGTASYDALGYNGTIPGPILRVREGQRLRVRLTNQLDEPTTVHWHGMILPNAMDGVPGLTQAPVPSGGEYLYEFAARPPGTRWYHSHYKEQLAGGLFGVVVVDDPHEEPADVEAVLVFHDVPDIRSMSAALHDISPAGMEDPVDSPEIAGMNMDQRMGDEVAYRAHCINGACYPRTKSLDVAVGQRVRLRIVNASPTQTRYIRLAEHTLRVTHSDGNPLPMPLQVDVLRVGMGERYDAWFEVTRPGAWLLQSISSGPLAFEQALVVQTSHVETAPLASPLSLAGARCFSYDLAGDARSVGNGSASYGRIEYASITSWVAANGECRLGL